MTIKNGDLPAMPICYDARMMAAYSRGESLGMTKREMFAMAAMQGLISVYWSNTEGYDSAQELVKCLAESSVEHADALLSELERTK